MNVPTRPVAFGALSAAVFAAALGSLAAVIGCVGIADGATTDVSWGDQDTPQDDEAGVRSEGGHDVIDAA